MEALEALVEDLRLAAENAEAAGDRQVALYDLLYRLGKEVARERLVREQAQRLVQRTVADEQRTQRDDLRAALDRLGVLERMAAPQADVDEGLERQAQAVERLTSRVTSIRNDLSDDIRSLGYRVDDLDRKTR